MTIIAWDGKTLASDSRCTQDSDIVSDNIQKLYHLNNLDYVIDKLIAIGVSGALADVDKIMHYLHSEDFPAADICHEIGAIIIGKKFAYYLEPGSGYLIRCSRKHKLALGSGGAFGRSAMLLGLNAKEAVKHAIKLNAACGGRVQTMEVK